MLPIGFLLAMYTQTGYDASAHTAEETQDAAIAAAQGVWRSVFFSALIGWFVLLAFLFAANDVEAVNDGAGLRRRDLHERARHLGGEVVILIADRRPDLLRRGRPHQRVAHLVRVLARPRRCPGWAIFGKVNRERVPFNAVIGGLVLLARHRDPGAVRARTTSRSPSSRSPAICTVGLYLAYIIPVYLRLRAGDSFEPGPWNLGSRYKIVNMLAIVFVILVVFALDLPYTPDRAALERRLRHERRELHAARDPAAAHLRRLVPGLGEGPLPGPGPHARRGRESRAD